MCSIAGVIDKQGEDISEKLKEMLELTEHRGPDGSGIAIGCEIEKAERIEDVHIECLEGESGLGHSRLRITGVSGIQPLKGCSDRFILAFNGEIWNYKELGEDLRKEGHKFKTDSDSEVIVHLVEEKFKETGSVIAAVAESMKILDGEYAFVVFDTVEKRFVLARDPVGIKQLYYGKNGRYIVFCSEKKPLWNLDIEARRVMPGEIVEIRKDPDGHDYHFAIYDGNKLHKTEINIYGEEMALKEYKKALFDAVEKRIRGHKKIGIIFSGGVDSVIIAEIARKLGAEVVCYTSGFKESSDVKYAKKAADKMGLKLRVNELTPTKISQELSNIIRAIESTNHLQVDVAIPIFFAVKLAKEGGIRVMLTGQGADELFAGYPWYPDVYKDYGPDVLNRGLWNDIKQLYKDTLEREDKITMYHSIELRVPFLDPEVIGVAMSISAKLKIKDHEVKYIHRKFADEIGIPSFISWRPKEPAQDGSNIHKELKAIIRERGKRMDLSRTKAARISEDTCAKLGSIYRYPNKAYRGDADIQIVLNCMGAEMDMR
ncbi:MAG: asparagine synthase (glutamine-hydrolyzing) [Candidatus Altiarchaeota archaeon]|nr:asparagine synthase (glutamine-hydrolyzing) [Candidatus Altiarchaeota archaeon]